MKNFKKELISILAGIGTAYFIQLFLIVLSLAKTPAGDFITWESFIPMIEMQVITPIIAWMLMGLLRVRWFNTWIKISVFVLSFTIPFAIISALTVFIYPALWQESIYWVANVIISIILAYTVFGSPIRNLSNFMGQKNSPK